MGLSSRRQQVCGDLSGTVLVGIQVKSPRCDCVWVLLAGQGNNSLIKIQCAYECGKIRTGDGFLSWGPRGC